MQMLYIIGSGSLHYNEELRFSLRSVQKHCPEINKIVVDGEQVHFLSNKVDYHYIEEAKGNKEYRIGMKIYNACKSGFIKGNFIFMNDDFFFTRPYDWNINYAKGELPSEGKENYQKALSDTREYLLSLGKSVNHFDCHTPIIYNSEKFIELLPHLEKSKLTTNGYTVKSLYGNIYELEPTLYNDCKLSTLQTESDFKKIKDTPVISCSDGSWQNGVRKYFKNIYPNKSIYEQ
jgi:hypothetical protein